MKKTILYLSLAAIVATTVCFTFPASISSGKGEKIKWVTFQEAVELNKKKPKKIFIDIFTDWCGWCKKMDASTFQNEVVAKYMNEHFYPVKMNAEMKDTIVFNNFTFVNPNPLAKNSTHQLAASLLNNKLSYPTSVYLDENFGMLGPVPGYVDAKTLEMILHYYGDEAYKNTPWADYQQSFQGEVK